MLRDSSPIRRNCLLSYARLPVLTPLMLLYLNVDNMADILFKLKHLKPAYDRAETSMPINYVTDTTGTDWGLISLSWIPPIPMPKVGTLSGRSAVTYRYLVPRSTFHVPLGLRQPSWVARQRRRILCRRAPLQSCQQSGRLVSSCQSGAAAVRRHFYG